MRILLCLVALTGWGLVCGQQALAQTPRSGSIEGSVVEGSNTSSAVEAASVRVLSLPDSSYIDGAATDSTGHFLVKNLPLGKYAVEVSMIGYETVYRDVQLVSGKSAASLGKIMLGESDVLLQGVKITANAIQVSVVEDTIVYNANAYRVPEGSMLEDLIKKIPGAEISDDGTIKINGKEVKKFLVDGKEFFSDDPNVASKNLPANMVDKLKFYERQSDFARATGIDDGEEEVVIDLTVKKGMKDGWVGNIFGGYGSEDRYEGALSANRFLDDSFLSIVGNINNTNNQGYREMGDSGRGWGGGNGGVTASKHAQVGFAKDWGDKLKIGGDFGYRHSDTDTQTKRHSDTQFNDSTGESSDSRYSAVRKRSEFNFNFRIEWKPDSMTTLIFRPTFSTSKTDAYADNESSTDSWERRFDYAQMMDTLNNSHVNQNISNSEDNYSNVQFGGRLNFIRRLNKRGRNFSINLNYTYQRSTSDDYSYSDLRYFQAADRNEEYNRYDDGVSKNHNLTAGFSYSEPLFKHSFLQFTYNFSYRKANSDRYGYEYNYLGDGTDPENWYDVDWGSLMPDTTLSSCYENIYITHNVGLNMRHITEKYNLSYGFSIIPQHSETNNLFGPNMDRGKMTQDVVNWSPNLRFRYRFTKQESLRINYRGRSSAPSIENLQDVISMTDPQNLRYGNPTLKPSFSHNVNIDYNKYDTETRRSFITFANFGLTQNSTANMTLYDRTTGARVTKIMNVNGNWNAGANFGFNTPLDQKNRFNINTFTRAYYSESVSLDNATLELEDIQQTLASHGVQDVTKVSSVTDLTSDQINWFSAPESKTRSLTLSQNLSGSFQNDWFEFRVNGSVSYNKVTNNTQTTNNRETFDYRAGASTNINLPWEIYVSTDCNYTHRHGYSAGLQNNMVMWNAQISKSFLKNNAATIRFKIYDILREQSNVSRSISAITITDTEYNTLGSYFMFNFVYKFNTLGGAAARRGNDRGPGGGMRPMGPPPGGFGGRR
ncbi:MAG: TonB-dependent receptor [Bacteroidaceae bacterium]